MFFKLEITTPEYQNYYLEHVTFDIGGFEITFSNDQINALIPGKIIYKMTLNLNLGVNAAINLIVKLGEEASRRRML